MFGDLQTYARTRWMIICKGEFSKREFVRMSKLMTFAADLVTLNKLLLHKRKKKISFFFHVCQNNISTCRLDYGRN